MTAFIIDFKNLYVIIDNIIGLFLVSINKKHERENRFYCAEFVKYILETTLNRKLLPEIVKPMDFLKLDDMKFVYEGLFSKYKCDCVL